MPAAGRNGGIPVDFQPMSPEQIERTMQFMLHQQAQVGANLASVSANLESLSKKTDGMADAIVALTALSDRTERTVREVTAGRAVLREAGGVAGTHGPADQGAG
jgi:hypothetical protein